MESRFGKEHFEQLEYQMLSQQFNQYLDQVDAALGRGFHEELYDTVMDYLLLEQRNAFSWGLRLGLQLQAL
jgi:glycyl-tRNA synthetase alpha subunit